VTRTNVEQDVGFLLAQAVRRFNQRLLREFSDHGFGEIRASYGSVLVPLFAKDGLRLFEVAQKAGLSKQAVTGIVKDCEQDGLVVRERDPDDGRAYRIRLSTKGKEFQRAAETVLAGLDDELVRALGKKDYAALKRALKGVMEL
jgi:DNA-binding MarR family transcriptional regulator